MLLDDLLVGAIDLHVHGYPDISLEVHTRVEDHEIASLVADSGMAGFVLKSHIWPTVGRAHYLRRHFSNIAIYSSITLNITAGGLNPISVESAAKQGAKVVFMPTWSAGNDLGRGGFSSHMKSYLPTTTSMTPEKGIWLLDENGNLLNEVKEVLDIARQYGMVIGTGHVSPRESLALAKEAKRVGNLPIIFSHPDSTSVGGTLEDMKLMTSEGAYVEICALGLMPAFQRIKPADIVSTVRELGVDKCVLSTDFFFDWPPPPPEMLRMTVGTLLTAGLTPEEIVVLIRTNPAKLLGTQT